MKFINGCNRDIYAYIDKIESYEKINSINTPKTSGVLCRGLIGGLLMGTIGVLAGAFGVKANSIFVIDVRYKDGNNSIWQMTDKEFYNFASCFEKGIKLDEIDDELYKQAIIEIMRADNASISFLQKKLRIGYNQAAELIEKMQNEGIVSAPDYNGKRYIS